jgi:hypothetical protein
MKHILLLFGFFAFTSKMFAADAPRKKAEAPSVDSHFFTQSNNPSTNGGRNGTQGIARTAPPMGAGYSNGKNEAELKSERLINYCNGLMCKDVDLSRITPVNLPIGIFDRVITIEGRETKIRIDNSGGSTTPTITVEGNKDVSVMEIFNALPELTYDGSPSNSELRLKGYSNENGTYKDIVLPTSGAAYTQESQKTPEVKH